LDSQINTSKTEYVFAGGSAGNLQQEAGGVKNAIFYKYLGVMITEMGVAQTR
jgi:hypothetical protein